MSWIVTLLTFSTFAVVSLRQAIIGQTSCGCFGQLSINPWYTFTLDLVIVASLVFSRPNLGAFCDLPRKIRQRFPLALKGLVAMLLMAGILLAITGLSFGSLRAAIAYFRGDRISVEPRLVDIGEGMAGDSRVVSVTLTNWTNEPIQVFGGTRD